MARPTLLMIHGLAGSLDYFDAGSRITRGQVQTCDLLGYGSNRHVESDGLTLAAQAEHVADLVARLDPRPVWVLGHSMGGAVAVLLADRWPHLVAGMINVEGNFTLQDAFWSSQIAAKTPRQWADEYQALYSDIPTLAQRWGIQPTDQRVAWLRRLLDHQPATTIYAMSKAILAETAGSQYLDALRRLIDRNLPIHLVAGEKSAPAWDVPDFVRAAARTYVEQAGAGHLMMLEQPADFCRIVDSILAGA